MTPESIMLVPEKNELYDKAIDEFGEIHQLLKFSSELSELSGRISQLAADKLRGVDTHPTLMESAEEYVDALKVTHAQFIEILRRSGELPAFLSRVNEYEPVALEKLHNELCNYNDV